MKSIYAGSFDPPTHGHIDIIKRATKLTKGGLTIGLPVNPHKQYMFTDYEKRKMIENAVGKAKVEKAKGILADHVYNNGYTNIIKGIRNEGDLKDEATLAHVNYREHGVETVFLSSKPENIHISSTVAKAVQKEQGDVTPYVTYIVKQALESKMSNQYFIGITGISGSGKSTLAMHLKRALKGFDLGVYHIDFDKLGHSIIFGKEDKWIYRNARQRLINTFGVQLLDNDGTINRRDLGDVVFNNDAYLMAFNEIMFKPMLAKFKEEIYQKQGIFLVDGALLAEADVLRLVNNNVILVMSEPKIAGIRLDERDNLPKDYLKKRSAGQLGSVGKKIKIKKEIEKHNHGTLLIVTNEDHTDLREATKVVMPRVLETLDMFGQLRVEKVFRGLGDENPNKTYRQIQDSYDTEGRCYHNWDHILDGLNKLWRVKDSFENPKSFNLVALAWLYHDIVYDVMSYKNEEDSFDVADEYLHFLSCTNLKIVKDLILATKHEKEPETKYEKIICDIDLSILGAGIDDYMRYEEDIREEYSFASDYKYAKGRIKVLQSFLDRDQIFYTKEFAYLEEPARINLNQSINLLRNDL